MSDRGYQGRANQIVILPNQTGYENQQARVYYRQLPQQQTGYPQQPQPMNQQDAYDSNASSNRQNTNEAKMDKAAGGNTRPNQPQTANRAGYPQGQGQPPQQQGQPPQQQGQPPQQHIIVLVPASSNYPNQENPPPDTSTPWAGSSFDDKKIRHAFIQKVYLILTILLLVTVVFICIFLFVAPVKRWVRHNSWFVWVSFAVYVIAYFILVCCASVRRTYPANYICLAIFNLAFSCVCAAFSSYFSTEIVLIAAGITTVVCLSVSIFAIQTRIDFTLCAGLLFVLSMVLFIFGVVCVLVYIFLGPIYILKCVYGAVAALVFMLFLAYDTQLVIGGRKYQLSPEEYIAGALQLYLDVGTLYIIILSFFDSAG